jgi:phosphoribosylaminoimidazole-succinocarboxamide synthase
VIVLNGNNQESEQFLNIRRTTLPGLTLVKRSLHKDIYDFGETLLIVANDLVLNPDTYTVENVPRKGQAVTKQSVHWFEKLSELSPSHYISTDIADFPEPCLAHVKHLQGRSMLVKKMTSLPVKCMVQGYLTGTSWLEYRETGAIAGIPLPKGLVESQRLPAPIFIPIPESSSDGDDRKELREHCGKFLSWTLRDLALKLYFSAWKLARNRDVLLVATVFRFGLYENKIHLIGECITPDSSRFSSLVVGKAGDYLPRSGQDMLFNHRNSGSDTRLDSNIQKRTADKFQNLYLKLVNGR